jgi:hypothetical protein
VGGQLFSAAARRAMGVALQKPRPSDRGRTRDADPARNPPASRPRAAGSFLVRSDCRSALCKREVEHTDAVSAEHFVDAVSSFIPQGSNAVIQSRNAEATLQTVVWFTRQGPAPMP